MMFKKHWQNQLQKILDDVREAQPTRAQRITVHGIGHELRGDDGAGPAVARALLPLASPTVQVMVSAHAPENDLGVIRRFAPTLVLFIDAMEMGRPPGSVGCWRMQTETTSAIDEYAPALMRAARYLAWSAGCEIALIGIQPATLDLDAPMSAAVVHAVATVIHMLTDLLPADTCSISAHGEEMRSMA